jgi:flagellar basal-body rod protein FlgF
MNVGLYQAISGMKGCEEQQHTIAANLTRANIAGNRQSVTAFVSALSGATPATLSKTSVGKAGDYQVFNAPPVEAFNKLDFTQGAIEPTGDPLSMAIQGDGFFTVREKSGKISYTRDGTFRWNTDGKITTQDGAELLGTGNVPISVPTTKGLMIDDRGSVTLDGQEISKLAVTHFKDPATDLQETSTGGRFSKTDSATVQTTGFAPDRICSGYLESSNGNPVTQMVTMIDVMRAYEANQKMAQAEDDATQRLIKTAGT